MIDFWSIKEVLNPKVSTKEVNYGQICFYCVTGLGCFLHNLRNEVA